MRSGIDNKTAIMDQALVMARDGLSCVTLRGVAGRVGIDHRTVVYHFGTVDQLRQAVAAEGLARGDGSVIARLIIDRHSLVSAMPVDDRQRWMAGVAG